MLTTVISTWLTHTFTPQFTHCHTRIPAPQHPCTLHITTIAGAMLPVNEEIRSLCVIIDQHLTFESHTAGAVKSSNYGSCYLTPSTPATPSMPASHIKGACTGGGVVWHGSGFGLDLALVILALVLVWLVWCVFTVLHTCSWWSTRLSVLLILRRRNDGVSTPYPRPARNC